VIRAPRPADCNDGPGLRNALMVPISAFEPLIAKTQGVSVRPTRKPRSLYRSSVLIQLRWAERRNSGLYFQEPPRCVSTHQQVENSAILRISHVN
jgi:hypothetical protein